jgi:hypothetical protein
VPPSFARDITRTAIPERRIIRTDANGCAYWWIEWGGELDVVDDNERIRDELQGAVYGIWDYIKNSGKYDADNLTLEWIGSVPGKREYRRFLGDHVLTQHNVLGQELFEDRVAFGGWSIDLHPPGGMYATERGSKHWHPDGNYHIPLRTLYSRNVRNLWMAGRNISASHVAFGTTRVMATCAVLGEAAGVAAALATKAGLTPRELATEHFDLVRKALHRADASVLGVVDEDSANLALTASVSASSALSRLAVEVSAGTLALDTDLAMVIPVDPVLSGLEVLVDASVATTLEVELHDPIQPQNYLPLRKIVGCSVEVEAGEKQWVRIPLDWHPDLPQNAVVVLRANAGLAVHVAESTLTGMVFFAHRSPAPDEEYTEQFREWKHILPRASFCFRLAADSAAYAPDKVVGGLARPYGGPQLWISEDLDWDPEPTLELAWPGPVEIAEVTLILDEDVEEDLINLHHHRSRSTPADSGPRLRSPGGRCQRQLAHSGHGHWQPATQADPSASRARNADRTASPDHRHERRRAGSSRLC